MKETDIKTKRGFRKSVFMFALIFCLTLSACQCFGIDPNLVGWWKFDEGSGTAANDSSGHNNNGTVYGEAARTSGQIDGALNFDGIDDYVDVPDNDNSLDIPNQMTITAWVKINNRSNYYCIATKQPGGTAPASNPGNYEFTIEPIGLLIFKHQTGTGDTLSLYESTSVVPLGTWQHVAVTVKKGDSVKFYINGASAGAFSQTATFGIVNNNSVRIGSRRDSWGWFYGGIDDVQIYNRALSDAEIQQVYYDGARKASNPVPASDESCVDPNIILTWQPGEEALSHDVYFGTTYSEVNNADINDANVYMGNQDVNSWNPGGLDLEITYYWRIDEVGSYDTIKGNIWSFTTTLFAPGKATDPVPANDSNNIPLAAVLSWTGGNCAVSSDVYFGTSFNDVNEANMLSDEFKGNQTATTYSPGVLEENAPYFWRIDEKNSYGTTKGDTWNFTTYPYPLPGKATNPVPDNGDTGVSRAGVNLIWTAGSGIVDSHDVYFGTANPPPFKINQSSTTYDTGTMIQGKVYYWRIDEKNGAGATTGNVWSFSVEECLKNTAAEYADWVAWGKPECWCYHRNCRGDMQGTQTGPFWVSALDLYVLKSGFNKQDAQLAAVPNGICCDFNHTKTGPFRVQILDLNILKTYFCKVTAQVPCCDNNQDCVLDATDKYNFWTN